MKLTKLNSSSESSSEQKDDSKAGVQEPLLNGSAMSCSGVIGKTTAPKASLCSSSSVESVGKGGNCGPVATAIAGSKEDELRSRRLTNSATGCVGPDACESGEPGDREGEVHPLAVEKLLLGRSLAWRSSAYTRIAARKHCQHDLFSMQPLYEGIFIMR